MDQHHSLQIHLLLDESLPVDLDDAALATFVESRGARAFRRFDRVLRSRKTYSRLGLSPSQVSALLPETGNELPTAIWCLLSMQRDGFLRERALVILASRPERIAFAALLNRTIDPVPQIARLATDLFARRLESEALPSIVWTLPLLDFVCLTPRGAETDLKLQLAARFKREGEVGADELTMAFDVSDHALRFSALKHFCRIFYLTRPVLPVLRDALCDPHPTIRLWAGRKILSETDSTSRQAVLQQLSRDSNPSLRLIALREFRKAKDVEKVESACFDQNASIRIYARRYLRKLGAMLDYRARALSIIETPLVGRRELIGALAVLSEFGTSQDRKNIASLLHHSATGVALEAQRTLSLLGPE